jgi:hypothetical protein
LTEGNYVKGPTLVSYASTCQSLQPEKNQAKKILILDSVANNIIKLSFPSYAEESSNYDVQRVRSMGAS